MKTGKNHEYLEDSLQNIGKIQYFDGFFLEAGFFIKVARREPRGRFSLRTTDYTVCALSVQNTGFSVCIGRTSCVMLRIASYLV